MSLIYKLLNKNVYVNYHKETDYLKCLLKDIVKIFFK